ncbi:MAG: HD domain-containing protein [Alphaproteobacteria bacterium]|nr:HD domain-containing protein [Alphaproteobacteria bacterium]
MYLCDKIYGEFDVNEPVFERIIRSETFRRLSGINMGCWSPRAPFYSTNYNRYEHSIGVWLLLRKYGASVPEQIAGLIHDVSHSAFSHLSDRIFGGCESAQTAQYQDSIHDNFVKNSELAHIITDCGYDLDFILDDTNFPLKELSLPDLCADRMDYCLRATLHLKSYGYMLDLDVKRLADSFVATPNGFVLRDQESARQFVRTFNFADEKIYSSFDNVFYEALMAQICRDAVARGIISRDDFWHLTDWELLKKMHDAGIDFSPMYSSPSDCRADEKDTSARIEYQKVRRINPLFITPDGSYQRLSDVDAEYAKYISSVPKYMEYKIKK